MHVDGVELAGSAYPPVVLDAGARHVHEEEHADVGVEADIGDGPDVAFEVRVQRLDPRAEVVGGIGQVRRQVAGGQAGIDLGVAGAIAARAHADIFRTRDPAVDGQHGVEPLGVAHRADQPEQAGVVVVRKGAEGRPADIEARRIVIGQVEDADRPALADRIAAHLVVALHAELARDLSGGGPAAGGCKSRQDAGVEPQTDQLTAALGRASCTEDMCSRRA